MAIPRFAAHSMGDLRNRFFSIRPGGLLRHRGMVLFEHLGFAFVAAIMVVWLAMSAAQAARLGCGCRQHV